MSRQFPFLNAKYLPDKKDQIENLESGDWGAILSASSTRPIFPSVDEPSTGATNRPLQWRNLINENVKLQSEKKESKSDLFLLGLASFQAFLQSNVTGPPLSFRSASVCFPGHGYNKDLIRQVREDIVSALTVDGEAIYKLAPHIELFYVAKILLNHKAVVSAMPSGRWARLRVNFWHQKMLGETAPALQSVLFKDLEFLEEPVLGINSSHGSLTKVLFLLERAAIHTFFGFDEKARTDLNEASRLRQFEYVLTGRLGTRTKFQQQDISQLVVLAKSHDMQDSSGDHQSEGSSDLETVPNGSLGVKNAPKAIDLDDDTLLNKVSFAPADAAEDDPKDGVPESLARLDPAAQPLLDPVDATILLSFASSITNTSPDHGLTREETLPYASRVIDGGSSNWQVYTQALLVRSRIETHKARTVERGVLQLQAVVDQVIAETSEAPNEGSGEPGVTTFLPRVNESDSAPASQRLQYIHQLSTPPRWALEAELASQWASLGGLRTAQEIFERLEMWADASLCLAATDKEGDAIRMVRRQLFHSTKSASENNEDAENDFTGSEREHLPVDAPRLFCILGDIEQNPEYWLRAWEISKHRYARAQESLGKFYLRKRDLDKADESYAKSLVVNPQSHATWFSLGCVRLETSAWAGAIKAFQRCVQIDPDDAEAWSNLAAALLHLPSDESLSETENGKADREPTAADEDDNDGAAAPTQPGRERRRHEAFMAFKRAANLKHDSYRIWQNVLNVGATIVPPPYADILIAQTRLIDLRAKTEGEGCVDVELLEGILQHIVTASAPAAVDEPDAGSAIGAERPAQRGLEKMFSDLVHKRIVPLITHSRRLWQLVAKLALRENRPTTALDAYEKAWRTTLNQPGWDDASEAKEAWTAVQEATQELVDAYESLGERETTEGLAAGSGALVCANWKFKARSAIRSVVGRRTKAGFEDVRELRERMGEVK